MTKLSSNVSFKEIAEYLTILVPGVRKLLVDPAPEVRTVASKALGAIVRHSPPVESEKLQSEIVPWLKEYVFLVRVSPTSTFICSFKVPRIKEQCRRQVRSRAGNVRDNRSTGRLVARLVSSEAQHATNASN